MLNYIEYTVCFFFFGVHFKTKPKAQRDQMLLLDIQSLHEVAKNFKKAFERLDYNDIVYLKMKEENHNPTSTD